MKAVEPGLNLSEQAGFAIQGRLHVASGQSLRMRHAARNDGINLRQVWIPVCISFGPVDMLQDLPDRQRRFDLAGDDFDGRAQLSKNVQSC